MAGLTIFTGSSFAYMSLIIHSPSPPRCVYLHVAKKGRTLRKCGQMASRGAITIEHYLSHNFSFMEPGR
jgi:hypothetical protein